MTPAELIALPRTVLARKAPRETILIALAAVAAIWPTWPSLVRTWETTADYSHGPLIAAVSVIWLIGAAMDVESAPRQRSWQAAALLFLALLCWLIAFRANVEIGKQLIAPPIVLLAVATAVGWRAARAVLAPVLYLYFAIPVWELIVPILQGLTIAMSTLALGLLGVPVKITGLLVTIPEGSFIVQEGCAGKRYLIVALAVAAAFAAFSGLDRRRTLTFLAISAGLAMLANWIRVDIIIYAGHVTNMKHYFVAREHLTLGWGIFVLLLIAVCIVGSRFKKTHRVERITGAQLEPASRGRVTGPVTAVALLAVQAIAIFMALQTDAAAAASSMPPAPPAASPGGWRDSSTISEGWAPTFATAARQARHAYESDSGERVETYQAMYVRQSPGSELIQYANRIDGDKWSVYGRSVEVRRLSTGETVEVISLQSHARGGSTWLIEHVYMVDGVVTTKPWMAQLVYALKSLTGPAPAEVFAVAAPCADSCAEAGTAVNRFWSSLPRLP